MFNNRSAYIDVTHALVKMGYEEFSQQLIENTLIALKRDELNDSHRDYLISCLQKTIKTEDANKGFGLKNNRGEKKKPTALRDMHAAALVIHYHNRGVAHQDALEMVVRDISKIFPEAPVDTKAVEKAYTQHKSKLLENWTDIEPNIRAL